LFLADPYASTFALKPSAERYLGLPPEERDAVKAWVLAHVPGSTARQWGAHIAKAPGALVGRYAVGDVVRTRQLFDALMPTAQVEPYQREQLLMPILAASTKRGIDLARPLLEEDAGMFEIALSRSTNMIYHMLDHEFNVDSDQELILALDSADAVVGWSLTEKGNRSVARKALHLKPEFQPLRQLLDYRGMLSTCLSTFVRPWLIMSSEDGKVHPEWNSTRGERTKDAPNGTRTGRLSSSNPNFQNVPNGSDIAVPKGLPALPQMRKYVLPPEGHIWLKRDFSAQEMRIMAHFAEGKLYDAYQKDPNVDPHDMVRGIIYELLGLNLPRKHVKITGFGIMYGMGIQKLADGLEVDYQQGAITRDAYFTALPEVRRLSSAMRKRGTAGLPITTWGGRRYYREPHPERDLSYKLLNYAIQGSAADQTKQSIIDWQKGCKPTDVFLASVHDEINVSAPIEDKAPAMYRLRTAMDANRFDVPFRSEGFAGPNWQDIQPYEA
jgi:DNA polymerase-1